MQDLQQKFKKMKKEGYTLEEIGKEHNISRQRVYQVIHYNFQREEAPVPAIEQIIYPNIRQWLLKNNITPKQLAKKAGIPYYTLYSNLTGRTNRPRLKTARKVCDILNMSIPQAFAKENNKIIIYKGEIKNDDKRQNDKNT